MLAQKRKPRPTAKPDYNPTKGERPATRQVLNARAPRVKVSKSGGLPKITLEHPKKGIGPAVLMEAIGTADLDFLMVFSANSLTQVHKAANPTKGGSISCSRSSRALNPEIRLKRCSRPK
jgi:hypothetical protein